MQSVFYSELVFILVVILLYKFNFNDYYLRLSAHLRHACILSFSGCIKIDQRPLQLFPLALILQPAQGLYKVLNKMKNWAVLAALVLLLLTALVTLQTCHAVPLQDDELSDLSRTEDDITLQGDERVQDDSSRSVRVIIVSGKRGSLFKFRFIICTHFEFGCQISGVVYDC